MQMQTKREFNCKFIYIYTLFLFVSLFFFLFLLIIKIIFCGLECIRIYILEAGVHRTI